MSIGVYRCASVFVFQNIICNTAKIHIDHNSTSRTLHEHLEEDVENSTNLVFIKAGGQTNHPDKGDRVNEINSDLGFTQRNI